jgi:hypothetical protein
MQAPPQLTLYHRPGCHLCQEMEGALRRLQPSLGFQLQRLDVDADTRLRDQYGWLVPLLFIEQREICRYFLDEGALHDALEACRT